MLFKNKAPKDLINYIKDKISKAKFEFIIESNYIEELLSQKILYLILYLVVKKQM